MKGSTVSSTFTSPAPPSTPAERSLVKLQASITKANLFTIRQRDALMDNLNAGHGVTQRRLAELLSFGSEQAGGGPLTENAVQRALRVIRGGEP